MALNVGTNHIVLLQGNLKNEKGILLLNNIHKDLSKHLWQVSLHELTYKCYEPIQQICGISINYVKDSVYHPSTKETLHGFPILKQFILQGKANEMKLVRFEPMWFYVTNFEDEIILHFHNLSEINKPEILSNCDVNVSCIFQRVK